MSNSTLIQLEPYDPVWPEHYQSERNAIIQVLGLDLDRIEHIGSTSIPGMEAKPIIDIQAEVTTLQTPPFYGDVLSSFGFAPIDSGKNELRAVLRKRGDSHANLHIVKAGSWAADRTILFRDALREGPDLVVRYASIKRNLASESESLLEYTLAKIEFIEKVIRDRCVRLGIHYNPGNRR